MIGWPGSVIVTFTRNGYPTIIGTDIPGDRAKPWDCARRVVAKVERRTGEKFT